MKRKGFTLIELLIVVAIIGILAAIAIPNFLQAQVRAKVARAQADQRSLSLAFETYRVDQNAYPVCDILLPFTGINTPNRVMLKYSGAGPLLVYDGYWPTDLTTPTDYLSSLPKDPFPTQIWDDTGLVGGPFPVGEPDAVRNYMLWLWPYGRKTVPGFMPIQADIYYSILSPGPTQAMTLGFEWNTNELALRAIYDPSNGTVSIGNITRFGP